MNFRIDIFQLARKSIDLQISDILNTALVAAYIVIFHHIGVCEKEVPNSSTSKLHCNQATNGTTSQNNNTFCVHNGCLQDTFIARENALVKSIRFNMDFFTITKESDIAITDNSAEIIIGDASRR